MCVLRKRKQINTVRAEINHIKDDLYTNSAVKVLMSYPNKPTKELLHQMLNTRTPTTYHATDLEKFFRWTHHMSDANLDKLAKKENDLVRKQVALWKKP